MCFFQILSSTKNISTDSQANVLIPFVFDYMKHESLLAS